jgi:hypothetical protein
MVLRERPGSKTAKSGGHVRTTRSPPRLLAGRTFGRTQPAAGPTVLMYSRLDHEKYCNDCSWPPQSQKPRLGFAARQPHRATQTHTHFCDTLTGSLTVMGRRSRSSYPSDSITEQINALAQLCAGKVADQVVHHDKTVHQRKWASGTGFCVRGQVAVVAPAARQFSDAIECLQIPAAAERARDGSSLQRERIARGKAHGALNMGVGSRALATRAGISVLCIGLDVMAFRQLCETTVAAANAAVESNPALFRPPAPTSGFPGSY